MSYLEREEGCGENKKMEQEGMEWCFSTGNRAKITPGICLKCNL